MNAMIKVMTGVTAGLAFTLAANAAVSYGASNAGEVYVGTKVGQFDVDMAGAPKVLGYGVYGGYNFDQNFGAEIDYVGSENKDYGQGLTVKAKSYGAYGTYRYAFANNPVYVKGKLGIAKTESEDKAKNGSYSKRVDEFGLAGGVGIGLKASDNFAVEANYGWQGGDATLLSLGAHVTF